jgi:hypothetical protein
MRYSLWSHDRLLGYTELDIPTITPTMRQGFVEPIPEGRRLLEDATGVWRAMAERKRRQRARGGEELAEDDDIVTTAMGRRETLDLELRDDRGDVFESEYIRVYDLFDSRNGTLDAMCDTEEEQEAAFEIEEFVAELRQDWKDQEMYGSNWPPPIEDPRWETMQYHLQVHLKGCFDDLEIPGFEGSAE